LALIGVGIVVTVLAIVTIAPSLFHQPSEQWEPPLDLSTFTPVSEEDAVSQPNPTDVWTDDATPQTYPAWWTDQMFQDENGAWWPPDEVLEAVRQSYNATYKSFRRHLVDTSPPDYDGFETALHLWTTGPILRSDLDLVAALRAGEQSISFAEWEHCLIQVQDFDQDGLSCTVGWVCQDGTISEHNSATGQLLGQRVVAQSGLLLIRMVYHSDTGRWQRFEMLEFFPPE
jgi:hypothetical protein